MGVSNMEPPYKKKLSSRFVHSLLWTFPESRLMGGNPVERDGKKGSVGDTSRGMVGMSSMSSQASFPFIISSTLPGPDPHRPPGTHTKDTSLALHGAIATINV